MAILAMGFHGRDTRATMAKPPGRASVGLCGMAILAMGFHGRDARATMAKPPPRASVPQFGMYTATGWDEQLHHPASNFAVVLMLRVHGEVFYRHIARAGANCFRAPTQKVPSPLRGERVSRLGVTGEGSSVFPTSYFLLAITSLWGEGGRTAALQELKALSEGRGCHDLA